MDSDHNVRQRGAINERERERERERESERERPHGISRDIPEEM
jgi:hypothetical protein